MHTLPNNVYAVILAGGSGTRFWPKSRHKSPKQLCAIGNDSKTMIELTLERLEGFIPKERRIIVTHKDQVEKTKEITSGLCDIFIAEPDARNTANALALAAIDLEMRHNDPNNAPIMVSLHADAVIEKEDTFKEAITNAVKTAEQGYLTTLGINPLYPETGYGYIEKGADLSELDIETAFKVKSFREKPDLELAKQYLATKKFYWNAGIFVWKVSSLMKELEHNLPTTVNTLNELTKKDFSNIPDIPVDVLAEAYSKLPKISIDNAVLEVSNNVAMIEADIGWQDIGSWDALSQCFKTDSDGNLIYGNAISLESTNMTLDTDGPFIACLGMEDTVVVASKGAILVCPKNRSQEVKKIVEHLKEKNIHELL